MAVGEKKNIDLISDFSHSYTHGKNGFFPISLSHLFFLFMCTHCENFSPLLFPSASMAIFTADDLDVEKELGEKV